MNLLSERSNKCARYLGCIHLKLADDFSKCELRQFHRFMVERKRSADGIAGREPCEAYRIPENRLHDILGGISPDYEV
jgi:hypothetical protein